MIQSAQIQKFVSIGGLRFFSCWDQLTGVYGQFAGDHGNIEGRVVDFKWCGVPKCGSQSNKSGNTGLEKSANADGGTAIIGWCFCHLENTR